MRYVRAYVCMYVDTNTYVYMRIYTYGSTKMHPHMKTRTRQLSICSSKVSCSSTHIYIQAFIKHKLQNAYIQA